MDIMYEVNQEKKKIITYEKEKNLLYVRNLKGNYGMIESDLLWYELFSTSLSDLGFKINPYERCISDKIIDENECTIRWFVDKNKVSHMDDSVK